MTKVQNKPGLGKYSKAAAVTTQWLQEETAALGRRTPVSTGLLLELIDFAEKNVSGSEDSDKKCSVIARWLSRISHQPNVTFNRTILTSVMEKYNKVKFDIFKRDDLLNSQFLEAASQNLVIQPSKKNMVINFGKEHKLWEKFMTLSKSYPSPQAYLRHLLEEEEKAEREEEAAKNENQVTKTAVWPPKIQFEPNKGVVKIDVGSEMIVVVLSQFRTDENINKQLEEEKPDEREASLLESMEDSDMTAASSIEASMLDSNVSPMNGLPPLTSALGQLQTVKSEPEVKMELSIAGDLMQQSSVEETVETIIPDRLTCLGSEQPALAPTLTALSEEHQSQATTTTVATPSTMSTFQAGGTPQSIRIIVQEAPVPETDTVLGEGSQEETVSPVQETLGQGDIAAGESLQEAILPDIALTPVEGTVIKTEVETQQEEVAGIDQVTHKQATLVEQVMDREVSDVDQVTSKEFTDVDQATPNTSKAEEKDTAEDVIRSEVESAQVPLSTVETSAAGVEEQEAKTEVAGDEVVSEKGTTGQESGAIEAITDDTCVEQAVESSNAGEEEKMEQVPKSEAVGEEAVVEEQMAESTVSCNVQTGDGAVEAMQSAEPSEAVPMEGLVEEPIVMETDVVEDAMEVD